MNKGNKSNNDKMGLSREDRRLRTATAGWGGGGGGGVGDRATRLVGARSDVEVEEVDV